MRLHNLTLTNWRCYDDRTFTFDGSRTLIIGEEGHGKSSILDAVRWLLSARCRGLDEGGKGVASLVKTGANKLSVSADITHNERTMKIARTFSESGGGGFSAAGFAGSSSEQYRAFLGWLGADEVTLSAVLDADAFLRMDHAGAKGLLLQLLRVEIALPDARGAETITLDELDRRYATAYANRREYGAQLKALPMLPEPPTPASDVQPVKYRLVALRQERDEKMAARAARFAQESGVRDGRRSGLEQAKKTLTGRLEAGRASLDRYLASWGVEIPPVPMPDGYCQGKLADAVAARDDAQAKLEALQEPDAKTRGTLGYDALLASAKALREHTPERGCVLSPDVSCPVKPKAFATAAKALERDAETLKADHDKLQAYEATRAELTDDVRQATDAVTRWMTRVADIAKHTDKVTEILKEQGDIDAQLADLPADAPARSIADHPMTAAINELDRRIAKGTEVEAALVALNRDWDAYHARKTQHDQLKASYATADSDATFYGPNGIRVAALTNALASFETAINAVLEPFGYSLRLSVDPWGIDVNGRKWVLLSTSERLRLWIALQAAMAITGGLGLTLIDNLEWLLPARRKILGELVMQAPLDQVIMARTMALDEKTPTVKDVQVIRLGV